MKKRVKNILLFVVLFVLGVLFSCCFSAQKDILIIENEFLVTFVGVVLGISATIVTFIFSSTDKIWKILNEVYTDKNKAKLMRERFKDSYNELIEDSGFIFAIFIFLIICVLVDIIDIPNISFPDFISKEQVLNAIKMGLFFNCLAATCDLFFSLTNLFG